LDPIIFAYGSLSGSDTISVTIDGFKIDGGNKASGSYRYVGILYRNVKSGTISNNILHSLYPPSGKGSGPQTFGILVYGDSDVVIKENEIKDFSRGGIGAIGDAGPKIDPSAVIEENIVYGNGLESETGWWAENGIQIGTGATGRIRGNYVYNCTVNNPYWSATGLLIVDTSDVVVESNYVEGCDIGIGAVDFPGSIYGFPWDYHVLSNVLITGNTLMNNTWQVDISNDARNVTLICNNILNAIEDGIDVWSYEGAGVSPTNVKINYNNIAGSGSYGLWVGEDVTETVDARYNWWGNATGPKNPSNPGGTGDEVYGNAAFNPWLLKKKVPPLVHDVAVINVVTFPSRAVVGTAIQVNVTVKNEGNTYETFDVSLDYNGTLIGTQTVTDMVPGSTKILSFSWSTTSLTPGVYNITAVVSTVPGEADTTDNSKLVRVKIGPNAPVLKVEPQIVRAQMINKTFDVNVTINDLWPDWNVVGVQFRLSYNSTLLEVVNVTEGPFMKQFDDTLFIFFIEKPLGEWPEHVLVGIILMPPWARFPYGSGTLATITFKIVYQEKVIDPDTTPPLTCELMLFDKRNLFLVDNEGWAIPYSLEHGLYEIYPTHICDVNGDYYIGIDDVVSAAEHFGSDPIYWPERWDPSYDVNKDNYVGIDDIVLIASNFAWMPTYDP